MNKIKEVGGPCPSRGPSTAAGTDKKIILQAEASVHKQGKKWGFYIHFRAGPHVDSGSPAYIGAPCKYSSQELATEEAKKEIVKKAAWFYAGCKRVVRIKGTINGKDLALRQYPQQDEIPCPGKSSSTSRTSDKVKDLNFLKPAYRVNHKHGVNYMRMERRMRFFCQYEAQNPLDSDSNPPKVRAWPRDNTAGGYRVVCPYCCSAGFHTYPEGGMGFKESRCKHQPDNHRGFVVVRPATFKEICAALGRDEGGNPLCPSDDHAGSQRMDKKKEKPCPEKLPRVAAKTDKPIHLNVVVTLRELGGKWGYVYVVDPVLDVKKAYAMTASHLETFDSEDDVRLAVHTDVQKYASEICKSEGYRQVQISLAFKEPEEKAKEKETPCPQVSSCREQNTDKEYFLWVWGFRAAVDIACVRMQKIDEEIKAVEEELGDIIVKKRYNQEYLYRWIDGHWRYFGKAGADDVRTSMKKRIQELKEKRKHVHEEVLQHNVGMIEGPQGAHYIVDSKDVGAAEGTLIPLKELCPWIPRTSGEGTDKAKG